MSAWSVLVCIFDQPATKNGKNKINKHKISPLGLPLFVFLINRPPKAAVSSKYLIVIKLEFAQEYFDAADYHLQHYSIPG